MIERNLDGQYHRVERDDRWHSLCLSDMTEDERRARLESYTWEQLYDTALYLARVLRDIGDELDLGRVEET